jgi:sugar phosphate isomerase/epimerase
MQLSLNLMTILRAGLEESIGAAAEAGFESVDLWVDSVEQYLAAHTADDLRHLLDTHHMRALSVGDIESVTFCNPEQFEELCSQCKRIASIARAVSCPTLAVSASVRPRHIREPEIASETASVLGKLLDIVESEGVSLALAFRGFDWCAVNSLEQARQAVAFHAGRHIGLVLDTFDLHATGVQPETLESLDSSEISVLRLGDCGDVPRAILSDTDRVLPGEGIADLDAMLDALLRTGFAGPISLKVLNQRLWSLSATEAAKVVMAIATKYAPAARQGAKR